MEPETLIRRALEDKYEIVSVIGKGGMATVYKAIQSSLGRPVALKVIHQNLVHDEEFVKRFIREAQVCASLHHPNIVTIYDIGSVDTVHYIAMEFLEGNTLRNLIRNRKILSVDDTIRNIIPVAEALHYMHGKGIVHRDVKSSNIFITYDGRPVLMDFGIVYSEDRESLSREGSILGTPEYMSPEQAKGIEKIDGRSDIYSLGVILFECLTGQLPFYANNYLGTLTQVLHNSPPSLYNINSKVPSWLNRVVKVCLEKDRDFRVQDGLTLAKALREKHITSPTGPGSKHETHKIGSYKSAGEKRNPTRPATIRKKRTNVVVIVLLAVIATLMTVIAFLMLRSSIGAHNLYPVRAAINQNKENRPMALNKGVFTDLRDGNRYNWVRIGNQVWMAENLAYLPYVNLLSTESDVIPHYYIYGYDGISVNSAKSSSIYEKYGVLYNWPAAVQSCPTGWHLPDDSEWLQLIEHISSQGYTAAVGKALKSSIGWYSSGSGSDNFGFSALPGGCQSKMRNLDQVGKIGYWWSGSGSQLPYVRYLSFGYDDIYRYYPSIKDGYSVRCVRD